jgi:hypothetical protein
MEWPTIFVIILTFDIVNIVMHGMGTWLLACTYMRGQKSTQTLYLINLALSELIKNMVRLIWELIVVVSPAYFSHPTAFVYTHIFSVSGVFYNYMLSMFYITGDRLLHIILNLRYPVYWSIGKTKRLLICTWVFCLTISTSLILVYHFIFKSAMIKYEVYLDIIRLYIPFTLYIISLLFAIVTYTVMFLTFARSRSNTIAPQSSLFNIFINSRFFICVLLMTSFLLLTVIPNLIRLFAFATSITLSKQVWLYIFLSTLLSDFIDAIVYIFLQPDVRKLLLIKLSCGILRNVLGTRQHQVQPPPSVPMDSADAVVCDQGSIIRDQIQPNTENGMATTTL